MKIISASRAKLRQVTAHYKRFRFPKVRILLCNITHYFCGITWPSLYGLMKIMAQGTSTNADTLAAAIVVSSKALYLSPDCLLALMKLWQANLLACQ